MATYPKPGDKFFAYLHKVHGGKSNIINAQVDFAFTIPLRELAKQ